MDEAGELVRTGPGAEVLVYSMGWRQNQDNTFAVWLEKIEIGGKDAVLMRPHLTITWRCKGVPEDIRKLLGVMRGTFWREGKVPEPMTLKSKKAKFTRIKNDNFGSNWSVSFELQLHCARICLMTSSLKSRMILRHSSPFPLSI